MKVLLISPLPGLDPPCGDVTYSENLLSNPPAGVEYENYDAAIKRGALIEHGKRSALSRALASGQGIVRESALTSFSFVINRLRRAHWFFWEPFRFFSVRPGEYDLIHLNVFNARFDRLRCPLVVSNAGPVRSLYIGARGHSEMRVKAMEACDIGLARLLGVNLTSYRVPQAARVIAFTQFLKNWYVSRHIVAPERIDVIPVFLPSSRASPRCGVPRRVGFISKDFDARGGNVLLRAWKIVRASRPDAELVIRSDLRMTAAEAASRNIILVPYVSREVLMDEILPSFDVFAYPTEFDGFYVLIEAMSRGIPIATSNYQGIPEFVDYGRSGLISATGDAESLAANILRLLLPSENAHYSAAARDRFESYYSSHSVLPRIHECYEAALAARQC